ncbi:transglutaminase-like cysteine peptidase [Ancylobacter amanitiformis]|uniref:Transglutaminase-like cysteine proteinase n=1 Tax=Ancylobacter amanitiformis TaxID=217069 RepID=A0ABU0LKU9_9HYPH|nr:transglutaminase-like cysteine peptidase [Ancylobacter amanitiformis]MDQ0509248.1 putative transglutaminase-like cysteine proteinase [Ancylobacter amanitiformis]
MNKRLERARHATVTVIIGALLGVFAGALPVEANDRLAMHSSFPANMVSEGKSTTPIGYAQFCEEYPRDCGSGNARGGKVALTEANFAQLTAINAEVNQRIKPMTDLDHYGVAERWTYAEDGYGDCEEYVLVKRRELIALGWPAETLLITVVRDRENEGHAVLTVVTDRGDLVLDNQESGIVLWHETGYRFVKRQAQGNPDRWVSLGDVMAPLTVGQY